MKHLLLVGDLGVGTNFVKNICFTDLSYESPFKLDYLNTIYKSSNEDLSKFWLTREYNTRGWQDKWNIDLSDNIADDAIEQLKLIPKTIFVNHSSFNNMLHRNKLLDISKELKTILLIPETLQGFNWQMRAYISKKGLTKMHNFSFPTDVEKNKKIFIEQYGLESYTKFNLCNMYEICQRNWHSAKEFFELNNMPILYTDDLYKNKFEDFLSKLLAIEDINLNIDNSKKMYKEWLAFHWPYEETDNWDYSYEKIKL